MSASGFFKGLLFVSGWAVAGWLLIGAPMEPIQFVRRGAGGAVEAGGAEAVFKQWESNPSLSGSLIALCVLDAKGAVVYQSPLAETALCPASALKTVTTAAALELLGPDYRFETTLTGTVPFGDEGILEGNLVLIGSGDPTLSSEDLEAMAANAAKAGLKQVTGRVLVDASLLPIRPANDHWNWGDIGNAYGAGAYGINVDHNRMMIRFQPGANEGDAATVLGTEPPVNGIQWLNHVTSGPPGSGDGVVIYSEPYGSSVTLHGTVPAGEAEFAVSAAIPNPPALASAILKAALVKAGVKVLDQSVNTAGNPVPLATHRSPALPELIEHLHRVSDNLEAQCLFLTMGRLRQSDPAALLKNHWESRGVNFRGLRLIDGSGLARATMIRPVDLARINHLARRGAQGQVFRDSLKSYVGGAVRSKLGAMSGVKTDVGFLTLADGREFTFALMANGLDPALDFWPLREKLLEELKGKL
ncbi:D-alanyl-D-alanine carboxypeptidase/D-alanyl-D-alanine-endopeptidase [Luteolibacter sp. GHJ8]|uniref:D-alanyl-D-alanine carboxypeptidase/D-alanyl-D-alanine-endopeptidase n=1 Tax=Luteolibacter rhizosphaerae TaxID=2989719 RepID=A0ABT3G7D8_9BACT|nr:D-alanyl-D-alanine carboxypeptidase/D-alanyl-D-alanine-endopeptidase [Luteolibacter rhizosphaerae]MCW1915542.1 D-alanyl-D-alanine carboxypeptidase/D-alanyl-D-alanine-endopeptidase [Luteolibacter rhizosphaerae]